MFIVYPVINEKVIVPFDLYLTFSIAHYELFKVNDHYELFKVNETRFNLLIL